MSGLRCAFLVMADEGDFVTDYELGIAPLESLGWTVELVSWRETATDWNRFQAVYICTPWDYPDDTATFMATLEAIDRSAALLVNDLSLVRWTLAKTYLRDLQERGANIVPSLWHHHLVGNELDAWFAHFATDRIIVKPLVSTNATDTFLLQKPVSPETLATLLRTFASRDFVVQPFIENIQSEGEFSLFFLGGEYSHAILKVPKARDFRVQEEHGAEIRGVQPEDALLQAARADLARVEPQPVYGRWDYVRGPDGRFLIMEMEIIEPSLYLRMDSEAPARFARAFDRHVRDNTAYARKETRE